MVNADNIKVTVVVPCHNAQDFVLRTLTSIENQTHKNLQVILVDDHSTDNTKNILLDFALNKQNFTVISSCGIGVSCARNTGIDNADGDYIAFIDSDDVVSPFHIETLLRGVLEHNADLSITSYKKVADKKPLDKYKFIEPKKVNARLYDKTSATEQFLSQKRFEFSVWNKLYSVKIIKDFNVRFLDGCKYNEDSLFNYKYLKHTKLTAFFDTVTYFYVQRKSSLVHKLFVEHKLDAYFSLNNIVVDSSKNFVEVIHYAHSIRAALTCEILFFLYKSDYSNPLVINKIIEYINEDVKHLKRCKRVHLYRRVFMPLVPPLAKLLLFRRRKKPVDDYNLPDSMKII